MQDALARAALTLDDRNKDRTSHPGCSLMWNHNKMRHGPLQRTECYVRRFQNWPMMNAHSMPPSRHVINVVSHAIRSVLFLNCTTLHTPLVPNNCQGQHSTMHIKRKHAFARKFRSVISNRRAQTNTMGALPSRTMCVYWCVLDVAGRTAAELPNYFIRGLEGEVLQVTLLGGDCSSHSEPTVRIYTQYSDKGCEDGTRRASRRSSLPMHA